TSTESATLDVKTATTATNLTDANRCVGSTIAVTFTTTASGTGPFTYVWKKNGVVIVGATTNSYTVNGPITMDHSGTYSVEVTGACNTTIKSAVLTVNPLPIISCSATPSQIDIMSAAHNSQLNVDLSANADSDPTHYSYSWTEDGAGSFNFNNVKNPVYTAGILDAAQTVSFTVTVTNLLTGCVSTSNCSLTVNTIGSCPEVPTAEICNGSTNEYTASRAPSVNETWKWSVNNGATIDGADNAQTVKVKAGGQNFTLTLTISYANTDISPSVCTYEVTVVPCGGYCTYTQGKYGNKSPACDGDGIGDGVAIKYPTVVDMIKAMLGVGGIGNPLVIGSNGKFITIPATASAAVLLNASMPGGSNPRELFGSCTVDNVPSLPLCWTPGTNTSTTYITKQGKINNVLLSQTITLGLNLRVSGGLGDFAIEAGTFATAKADGGCGSTIPKERSCYLNELGQLVVVNEYVYKTIPQSIIDALNAGGYDLTVGGLYALANDALGNTDLETGKERGASLGAITDAVASINEGFDECRIFIGWNVGPCEVPSRRININSSGVINSADVTALSVESLRVSAYPNPFAEKVSFAIVSPVSGKASLEIYNMFGQKLQTVYEGYLTAGRTQLVEFRPGSTIAAGTLVYKLNVAGKQVTGKLVNLKQ
ncbi:T9SS type A sorting domain-containing protein, partial [Lacibacter sp. H375]|uniref:T9SS type A sorting domain-containing protein n=1 Tax=Lacibacter sp. H375 TaxID=3133424 RepID=UPI0030BB16B4